MHINLIYNETAGDGSHSIAGIVKRLKDHGANVLAFNKKSADLSDFFMIKCDFLLIAGGGRYGTGSVKKNRTEPCTFCDFAIGKRQ